MRGWKRRRRGELLPQTNSLRYRGAVQPNLRIVAAFVGEGLKPRFFDAENTRQMNNLPKLPII